MLDALYSFVLAWTVSYLLHSSFLIAIAYLADRYGLLKNIRLAELVWRIALFGGLLTASLQMLSTVRNTPDSQIQPSLIQPVTATDQANADYATAAPIKQSSNEKVQPVRELPSPSAAPETPDFEITETVATITKAKATLTSFSSSANTTHPATHPKTMPRSASAKIITLPAFVRDFSPYLMGAWLLVALLTCLHTAITALRLNRLAQTFPLAYQTEVAHLFKRFATLNPEKIKLRISDQWNSPLVTPNGTICLPTWAYSQLTRDQFDAMLSHELSHVARHDPAWRLATQIYSRICFFQVLQWIAIRKLAVLAELACDQNAARSSGKPHDLAQALYICAKAFQAKEAPSLALAMSRGSSPLLIRIESLLDENRAPTTAASPSRLLNFGKFSLIATALVGTAYAMPPVIVHLENIPTLENIENLGSKVGGLLGLADNQPQSTQPFNTKDDVAASTESDLHQPALSGQLDTQVKAPTDNADSEKQFIEDSISSNELHPPIATQPPLGNTNIAAEDPSQNRLTLASATDSDSQVALGEMIWKSKADESSLKSAEDLLKKAAASGNTKAQKYLELFAEREKQQAKIGYYVHDFDGSEFKAMEAKCDKPTFTESPISVQTIEQMIGKMESFAACFNQYSESLRVSSADDKLVPAEILRLMSGDEAKKAIAHTKGIYAMLRVKAKITAEEFNDDKRHWEEKTRIYFNGSKLRDWSSIKRHASIPRSEPDLQQMQREQDPQIVKITSVKREAEE